MQREGQRNTVYHEGIEQKVKSNCNSRKGKGKIRNAILISQHEVLPQSRGNKAERQPDKWVPEEKHRNWS